LVRTSCQINSDTAHFGEVALDVFGKSALGMATPGYLGDMDSECCHAFKVSDDLNGADRSPQISTHWGLQGEEFEAGFLGFGTGECNILVTADDLFCQLKVGLQQCFGGDFHRTSRQLAHLGQLIGQRFELSTVSGPHFMIVEAAGKSIGDTE
jgi:hypothetical protein